jgi:hypothetical protein
MFMQSAIKRGVVGAVSLLACSLALADGFDWNKWSAIANEHPCTWLDAAAIEKIVGQGAVASRSDSASASRCTWKAPDGALLLSASVSTVDSAANMVGEREGQLRDIATGRFERLATSGVTTAVLRKDRLYVTVFPNSDAETAVLRIQGHPVLREDQQEREKRNQRLRAFTAAVIEKHEL